MFLCRYFKLLPLIFITILCACSKTHNAPSTPSGGQDSGGGETFQSSVEEINDILSDQVLLKNEVTRIIHKLHEVIYSVDSFLPGGKAVHVPNYDTELSQFVDNIISLDNIFDDRTEAKGQSANVEADPEPANETLSEFKLGQLDYEQTGLINYSFIMGRDTTFHKARGSQVNRFIEANSFVLENECSNQRANINNSEGVYSIYTDICFSKSELLKISPSSLRKYIHANYIFQLALTSGMSVERSLEVKNFLLKNYLYLSELSQVLPTHFEHLKIVRNIRILILDLDRFLAAIPEDDYAKKKTFLSDEFCLSYEYYQELTSNLLRDLNKFTKKNDRGESRVISRLYENYQEIYSFSYIFKCLEWDDQVRVGSERNNVVDGKYKSNQFLMQQEFDAEQAIIDGNFKFMHRRLVFLKSSLLRLNNELMRKWVIAERNLWW